MKIILEKYWTYDLIVWAMPIYQYYGSTIMKTVIDRLFINVDPHFIEVDGEYRHPRKVKHLSYYAVLAVGGFPAMNIFEPLKCNFRTLSAHTGIRLSGELYRHTCIPLTINEVDLEKKHGYLLFPITAKHSLIYPEDFL